MTAYHAAVAKAMTEDALMAEIATLCRDLGLLAYHTHNSRRSTSGYPDWHIVGPSGSLFRECKDEKRKATATQNEWITALRAVGHDADVWRPRDLVSGRIRRELLGIARLAVVACR